VDVVAAQTVQEIVDVLVECDGRLDSLGDDGDPIDVLSHSLQCAHVLHERSPDDVGLQVAGLVHDIGHVLRPGDAAAHGDVAAAFVEPVLGARVASLVALHVPAKRYLVATDPTYAAALSDGSTRSLARQGGAADADARARFEAEPHHADALRLRRADEAAKVVGRTVPGLGTWRDALDAVAANA